MTSEDREEWLRAEVKSLRSQITAAEAYRAIALERLRASTDQDRVKHREFVAAVRELVERVFKYGADGFVVDQAHRVRDLLAPEDES